jgi:four helix bundle protein
VGRLDDIRKLQDRTKRFAVAAIRFYVELPQNEPAGVIGRQLLRSSISVAANYRAAAVRVRLLISFLKSASSLLRIFSTSLSTAKVNR